MLGADRLGKVWPTGGRRGGGIQLCWRWVVTDTTGMSLGGGDSNVTAASA